MLTATFCKHKRKMQTSIFLKQSSSATVSQNWRLCWGIQLVGYTLGLVHHKLLLLFVLVALLLKGFVLGVTIDPNPDLGTPFR